MKQLKLSIYIFIIMILFIVSCQATEQDAGSKNTNDTIPLTDKFTNVEGVEITSVAPPTGYKEAYLMFVEQPIDHKNPSLGTFKQRVWVSFRGYNSPNVIITDGYSLPTNRPSEIADLLSANQIAVEHRFFGTSKPSKVDYSVLNLYQATNDLHHIKTLLDTIFINSWVSSGISKGGQTTIAYRYFFPTDVKASVPYVAPHTFEREDSRVINFISNEVATKQQRQKIFEFQKNVLSNKQLFLNRFEDFANKRQITFDAISGIESAFEHGILEFPFAFWQWGYNDTLIPQDVSNIDSTMFILEEVNPFDFFSDQTISNLQPYFYQALTEMGIYTYETSTLKDYLKYAVNPSFDFTMRDTIETKYSNELNTKIAEWLLNEGNNFIYIYGGYDPWFACAAEVNNSKTNALKLVAPKGSHLTRIKSFDENTKKQVLDSLNKWLELD